MFVYAMRALSVYFKCLCLIYVRIFCSFIIYCSVIRNNYVYFLLLLNRNGSIVEKLRRNKKKNWNWNKKKKNLKEQQQQQTTIKQNKRIKCYFNLTKNIKVIARVHFLIAFIYIFGDFEILFKNHRLLLTTERERERNDIDGHFINISMSRCFVLLFFFFL